MSIRRPDRDYPARGGGARQRPQRSDGWLPKSPSEALEPTRGPTRPRGTRRRREVRKLSPAFRALNGFLTLITVLLAGAAGAAFWFNGEVGRAGPLTEAKTVVIREGTGARDIAQRLEDEGVISSHHMFIAHYVSNTVGAWLGRKPFQLKAGEYRFEPGTSIRQVADTIAKGRAVLISVTIPEGLTSWQIVERLKANQGLSGDIATAPPDGALMPDTYKVRRGMSRTEVLDMMREEQARFMDKVWESRQADLPIKTREEALVLASIVEKETGKREERPQVAAVFVNRLRQGMRLQSDPTILYGLNIGQVEWGRPITRSDINSRTAHNTYQIPGLPPTPICNPGREAIMAVLKPAETKALYFVADGTGGHVFSETLKDHNTAVANWRKVEKEIRARQAAENKAAENGSDASPDAARTAAVTAAAAAATAGAVKASAEKVPLPRRKPKKRKSK